MSSQMIRFHSFLWPSNIPLCICTCSLSNRWALKLLPYLGHCKNEIILSSLGVEEERGLISIMERWMRPDNYPAWQRSLTGMQIKSQCSLSWDWGVHQGKPHRCLRSMSRRKWVSRGIDCTMWPNHDGSRILLSWKTTFLTTEPHSCS